MEDNVLIAEFMGGKYVDEDLIELKDFIALKVITIDQSGEPLKVVSTECFTENELSYHTSWDWLMPVVERCLCTDEKTDGQHYFINDSLLSCNIEVVYDRVVEFIKDYNDGRM